MKTLKVIFAFVFLFLLSSFSEITTSLFKNDKVNIYVKNNGIRIKYFFEKFNQNESYKVAYYIYTKPKSLIGSEKKTNNKELINQYITKYKQKAFESNQSKNDIELGLDKFKIVQEFKNDKIYFYYYKSDVNSKRTITNSGNLENKKDSFWQYYGDNKFLIDVFINDKLSLSKQFDFNK